jgi:hypothetical protein
LWSRPIKRCLGLFALAFQDRDLLTEQTVEFSNAIGDGLIEPFQFFLLNVGDFGLKRQKPVVDSCGASYECGSTIITSNLPLEDWTPVLESERLTGALLDRLTHHVHILTMNGENYRLKQSAGRRRVAISADGAEKNRTTTGIVDTETGEIFED